MKILKVLTRIYVEDLDSALPFYESLLGEKTSFRFRHLDLELAQVGDILILAGSEEALKPFKQTKATFLVDSIDQFKRHLETNKSTIIRGPMKVPTGFNMTVKHPDGTIIEYVEHTK